MSQPILDLHADIIDCMLTTLKQESPVNLVINYGDS